MVDREITPQLRSETPDLEIPNITSFVDQKGRDNCLWMKLEVTRPIHVCTRAQVSAVTEVTTPFFASIHSTKNVSNACYNVVRSNGESRVNTLLLCLKT